MTMDQSISCWLNPFIGKLIQCFFMSLWKLIHKVSFVLFLCKYFNTYSIYQFWSFFFTRLKGLEVAKNGYYFCCTWFHFFQSLESWWWQKVVINFVVLRSNFSKVDLFLCRIILSTRLSTSLIFRGFSIIIRHLNSESLYRLYNLFNFRDQIYFLQSLQDIFS